MTSRHVPTKRLMSGVLFSAPDEASRAPPDEPTRPSKKPKFNIRTIDSTDPNHAYEGRDMVIRPSNDTDSHFMNFSRDCKPKNISDDLSPEEEAPTLCLPVLTVSLTTTVDGLLAHTELLQTFHNPSNVSIDEARHTFPLYDGAVIIAFECTIGDERRVRGVVKPREQAQREYKKAVRNQVKAAALLEEHTPEIFQTSLGNIPAMATVEVKIVYIQELKVVIMEDKATEGVALTIPTSIAPRYSKSPRQRKVVSTIPRDRLDIWVRILNDGRVNAYGCEEESGHMVDYEGSKSIHSPMKIESTVKEETSSSYHIWHHHSQSPTLRKDFVFVIQMTKGHDIQSQAIACPPDAGGLAAMMVSIRPNDLFTNSIKPQSYFGEIIFLLDQSGSMNEYSGTHGMYNAGGHVASPKVEVMREAMLLAMSGIPSTCSFNVVSWGSITKGLWGRSRRHSPDNINEAKEYISQIEADLGGTDLLRALESTVQRCSEDDLPTQVIVLTDGELEPEESMQFVWRARQALQNRIRFFTLGIGGTVSHRLIESLAELGGGCSDIIDTNENPQWQARLIRLVKSALQPDSWNCNIDLGRDFARLNLTEDEIDIGNVAETNPVPYIQAPCTITALHPFRFNSVFFLVSTKKSQAIPNKITITTTTLETKERVYELPVKVATDQDGLIHRLAAKAVLVDLENMAKWTPTNADIVEKTAHDLGIMYSVTSKWTSFVAVSQDEPTPTQEDSMIQHYKAILEGVDITNLLTKADIDTESESEDDSEPCVGASPAVGASQDKSVGNIGVSEREGVDSINLRTRADVEIGDGSEPISEPGSGAHAIVGASQGKSTGTIGVSEPPEVMKRKRTRQQSHGCGIRHGSTMEMGPNTSMAPAPPKEHQGRFLLIDPLDWKAAIGFLTGQGLFELPGSAQTILHHHFCPNAADIFRLQLVKLCQKLHQIPSREYLYDQLLDSIMMIECYETHLASERDIWDAMMERTWSAMIEALELPNAEEVLQSLRGLLKSSMMHQHYMIATDIREKDGVSESVGTVTCPACAISWQSSRTFFCPFDNDQAIAGRFENWDALWKHQIDQGHMICRKDVL
ncbi:hypothetical protein FGRMN_1297 [Fusarium graminum]|nr:hypothetical protein FGRMN_1297 [Fusarium graminum]